MIYLDTSSLFKFLLPLPGDEVVECALAAESEVIISQLTELEMRVQLHARRLSGELTKPNYHRILEQFESLRNTPPFFFCQLSGVSFSIAIRQNSETKIHCRSLDRLHLAAMEELEITRLMTHDARQADAARAAGFTVIVPDRR